MQFPLDGSDSVSPSVLSVQSLLQVLADVYTNVLEAAHSLHQRPSNFESCECPPLSSSEVHNQLRSLTDVEEQVVVCAKCAE